MSIKKISFPYYLVENGENLNSIAKKLKTDPTKILLNNNLAPQNIKEGTILKIE